MAGRFDLYKYRAGDIVTLRKAHPCGSFEWVVIKAGMEISVKCMKCGHFQVLPRRKLEKATKNVVATSCDII